MADGCRLVAKRIVPGGGWIGAHTEDPGREALLVTDGWLAGMPPSLEPALIDAERADGAWWVLMKDVSDELGEMAAGFRARRRACSLPPMPCGGASGVTDPRLAPLARRLDVTGPGVAERRRAGLDLLPNQLEAAWEAFAEAAPRDVADPVLAVVGDPARLASWLEGRGTTLIHGDLRDEHLGVAGERVVLIDWGLATRGHPVVELCWYLCHCAWRIDATRDEIVEDFRRARGDDDDAEALEIGLLCGLVMYGWIIGHSAVVHPDPSERAWAEGEPRGGCRAPAGRSRCGRADGRCVYGARGALRGGCVGLWPEDRRRFVAAGAERTNERGRAF